MTTAYTVEWSLHTPDGRVELSGGTFGFDRSWAPQGAGTVTAVAGQPALAGLVAGDTRPLVLHAEVSPWTAATLEQTTLELRAPAPGLPAVHWWPAPTAATFTYLDDTPATGPTAWQLEQQPATASWYVWLQSREDDEGEGITTLQLATVEAVLQSKLNLSGQAWLPIAREFGGYNVADALAQLLRLLQIPATVVNRFTAPVVPYDQLEAWEPGQSAWDWWDRVRIATQQRYVLDPAKNELRVEPWTPLQPYSVPTYWALQHRRLEGLDAGDEFVQYADGLLLTWRWEVDGEERIQRDVVTAGGIPWTAVRRGRQLERTGPPIAGYAQQLVDVMSRWRAVESWEFGLRPDLLLQLPVSQALQSIAYDLGAEPRVELTILEEE